jgi:hypothetical protein
MAAPKTKKQLHFNFFEMACTGAHMAIGQWKYASIIMELSRSKVNETNRTPGDYQEKKDSLDYYLWLAKLAEKGKISCIFFADVYGGKCEQSAY